MFSQPQASSPTLKVVVIDANTISRNLLTSVLIDGGFEVVGDSNPSSAGIASMIKLQPQMVCIDIGATDEEGLAKIDMLRTALPKTVLLLSSGKFDPDVVQKAVGRGVHGFIVKPFKPDTVLKIIRTTVIKFVKQQRQLLSTDSAQAQEQIDD